MNSYSAVISLDWTALIRERDRLRMLRFADAWQAIGLAAMLVTVLAARFGQFDDEARRMLGEATMGGIFVEAVS